MVLKEKNSDYNMVGVSVKCKNPVRLLGIDAKSWAYKSTGQIQNNCKRKDYGAAFEEGDKVTAVLD